MQNLSLLEEQERTVCSGPEALSFTLDKTEQGALLQGETSFDPSPRGEEVEGSFPGADPKPALSGRGQGEGRLFEGSRKPPSSLKAQEAVVGKNGPESASGEKGQSLRLLLGKGLNRGPGFGA